MRGSGVTAQGVRIDLQLPAGATVVSAGGAQVRGNMAEWTIPTLAPKQTQTYTIQLSRAAAPGELKGEVHWSNPRPSAEDVINVAVPAAGNAG